jgi:uncharacterized protein
MTMEIEYERLVEHMRSLGSVLVAFSGGVDSSLVLAAAHDALEDRAVAVTACSPSYPEEEKQRAFEIAQLIGARHLFVNSGEFENPVFTANPPDRCYHCKRELFAQLRDLAVREGLAFVVDGSNADDETDYRPGHKAVKELAVRSPLEELGLGKSAIRELARSRGLPNWDQPACACLASRIPYGVTITAERLARIARVEAGIRELGFSVIRLRDHGDIARIEVGPDEIHLAFSPAVRQKLINIAKQQGYAFVCLDLEGYRTGSMNQLLK